MHGKVFTVIINITTSNILEAGWVSLHFSFTWGYDDLYVTKYIDSWCRKYLNRSQMNSHKKYIYLNSFNQFLIYYDYEYAGEQDFVLKIKTHCFIIIRSSS